MKQNKSILIWLSIILLFGFTIRFITISNNPFGFFCDEASIGYNAYSLLTKGTDEYGTSFPLFFRAFGEYKNPVQTYSTVPFIALFGLNELAVRLVSVMYGLLGIIGIFFLARKLFSYSSYSNLIGLTSALFLMLLPWHIHFSRVSLEGLAALVCFTIWATYFYFRKEERPLFLFLSILLYTFALYSYFPARIFIPLFVVGLVLFDFHYFIKKLTVTILAVFLTSILLFPLGKDMLIGSGTARFQQVSIFANHSGKTNVLSHIAVNYFSHFSLDFLFLKGDSQMPGQFITRHSVKGFGELYLIQLPFILIGLGMLLHQKQIKSFRFFIWWLLLYPTGSMFTGDTSAQATRSIIGMIPLVLLSAYGFVNFLFHLHKRNSIIFYLSLISLSSLFFLSSGIYLYQYFVRYPLYSSDYWGWQYGSRDIISYFIKNKNTYDEMFMAPEFNAPDIFFKFYAPGDCHTCHIGSPDTQYAPGKKQLFAVPASYITTHHEKQIIPQKYLYYPSGSVAFVLGEVVE